MEAIIKTLIGSRQQFGIAVLIILFFFSQGLFYTLKHVMFEVFDVQERRGAATELLYSFFAFGIIGGVFLFFSISISQISLFSFDSYQVPYTVIALELSCLSDCFTYIILVFFIFII